MLPIAQVSNPSLQRRRVVLAHLLAVDDDARGARDGGPLPAAVDEGDVDGVVGVQVVGLAGLGVGVEDEVDGGVFL